MAQLFGSGSGKTVSTQAVLAQGMQVQSSQYGLGLPIVYGRNRVAGNLIWYGDFQAVKHVQNVGKGGGGQNVSYTYSSSFQLALCEGPGITVGQIWQDSGLVSLSDINGTFSGGAATQAAWSHLGSPYNLQYPYTAWIGCLNLKLGSTPTVPNFNFELNGLLQYAPTASPPIYDAEPSAIITDLLTSTTHGLGFQYLGDLTLFKDYCVANNIFLSPVIKQEESMSSILNRLLKITNSTTGWSNGKLIVIPYGDESVTANGVTYTPPTTIQKYFTEQDYIKSGVQITRKPLNDRYNTVRLQWTDPNNNYTPSVAEAKDQADIDASGIRQMETVQGNGVTNGTLAQWIAQTILQRNLYIRNEYTFTTTIENVALEAGDVIALTDSKLKLNQEPVRIVRIAEQNNDELEFTCEEFPAGVSVGATQTVESAVGFVPNITGAPDATQPPVIVRAPQFLTDGKPEIWIAAAGSGPNWGGCNVLISTDNVTYTKMGHIAPGCRYGVLTTQCATSASDPDTTNSFNVSLYGEGQLSGGTQADADNLLDLMLVDTELISYSSTVLNPDGTYSIGNGYMRRGCYETGIAQHVVGAPWIRLDDSVFPLEIDPSWVGQTLYIILQAWNLYGGGLQQLSTLTPTSYVIGTAEEIPDTPPTPTNLTATGALNGNHLSWSVPNPAAVAITSIEYSTDNATWSVLGQVQGTHYVHGLTAQATYYYRIRSRSPSFIWSSYTTSVSATGGTQGALATANNVDLSTSQVTNVNQSTARAWLSPVDVPTVVTGEFVTNPPQGGYQVSPVNGTARQQPTPFAFAFNATVDGGIVEVLCQIAQNWGYGYMFRVDGRAGYYVGQILRMDNGTWANIGTQYQTVNAAALNGTVGVVGVVGRGGVLQIYVNGALYCSAVDTTYTPNGSMYMGWETVSGPTISPPTAQAFTLDYALDGGVRGAVLQSYLNGNRPIVNFSDTFHINKNLGYIADGGGRFASLNGSAYGISSVDGSNRVNTIGGAVSPLGSIATGASDMSIAYSSTSSSITLSWYGPGGPGTSGTINRMDGSQTTVAAGSVTVTGLSASTNYYAAAYYDESAQGIAFVTGQSGAVGSPAILYLSESSSIAWQANLQARVNLGWVPVATAASGTTGGGNGSSGCCLRGPQLIELANGVMREAQELTTGDVLSSPDGPIRITQLRFEPWAEWYRVEFNDGRILEVAPDHRFMDPSGVQIHARDLKLQTIVEARDCYLSVARLELCTDRDIKVGIEVEEPHVYYVDGVLSHNKVYC